MRSERASDGLHAIRRMEKTQFDVVIADLCMPQTDGLELLTEILDRWPDSRVGVDSSMLTWGVARLAKVEGAYALPLQVRHLSAPQAHSVRVFDRIS